MDIVSFFLDDSNKASVIILMLLAGFRIYLEIIGFDFSKLFLSKKLIQNNPAFIKFHKTGLIFSVGYILVYAPYILIH